MTTRLSARTWIQTTLLLVAACGFSECSDAPELARDRRTLRGAELPVWVLGAEPTLHIGAQDGRDEDVQFGYISGLHRLPNGEIAVLDGFAGTLKFFSPTGVLVGKVGGRGNGPGELPLRSGAISFTCGLDSVYVYTAPRVHVFRPPNEYVRAFDLSAFRRIRGCSQSAIVTENFYGRKGRAVGTFTDSTVLEISNLEGTTIATIDTFPADERVWIAGPEGWGNFRRLFSNVLAIDVGKGGIVVGYPGDSTVTRYDFKGKRTAIVPAPGLGRPIGAADIGALRGFIEPEKLPDFERKLISDQLSSTQGRRLPEYGEIKTDSDGRMWIRQYDFMDATAFFDRSRFGRGGRRPSLKEPRHWTVVDSAGGVLAQLTMPAAFVAYEIGRDWVLGVWTDELDVAYVRMYKLLKK